MKTYEELVATMETNLRSSGFGVSRGVTLPGGTTVDLAASRSKFTWKGLVINSQHLLLGYLPVAKVADFHTLFNAGFAYGQLVNPIPLPRGFQFGYMIFPVLAVDSLTPEVVAFVTSRSAKHWSLIEFPTLYDLSAGKAYYFEKTPNWGGLYYPDARQIIRSSVGEA